MKKVWLYWVLGPLALAIIIALYTQYFKEESVIKYFPLDEGSGFKSFGTTLNFANHEGQDDYEVLWDISSESDQPMYLRQDVSLLYVNGRLKGIVSKWEENTSKIEKETSLHGEDSQRFEAISFHHGEIHEGDEPIKSIQASSKDTLYIIDSPHSMSSEFKKPKTPEEKEWKKRLDHTISQQIEAQWEELIAYYGIKKENYTLVPLTELAHYDKKPFPGTTEDNFERIKGQLWEGLYKNYVLGLSDTKSSHPIQSYTPLILFDKKGQHLIVLYEDDTGKKHRLIQKY